MILRVCIGMLTSQANSQLLLHCAGYQQPAVGMRGAASPAWQHCSDAGRAMCCIAARAVRSAGIGAALSGALGHAAG